MRTANRIMKRATISHSLAAITNRPIWPICVNCPSGYDLIGSTLPWLNGPNFNRVLGPFVPKLIQLQLQKLAKLAPSIIYIYLYLYVYKCAFSHRACE